MNRQKRKQHILKQLEGSGEVEIRKLGSELNISEITIRRDLNQLAEDGLLYRTHGGAMKVNPLELPSNFINKAAINSDAKDLICRRAAAEINNGDIIFMDCGSTVFRLCPFIRNKKIRVITNSIPVLYALQNCAVSINMIGGEVDAERQAMHGRMAAYHIKQYRVAKAFLGVDGISANGLFANSETEAQITLAMAGQSAYSYFLCDAGKVGKESYLKFAEPGFMDAFITDCERSRVSFLRNSGVKFIGVKK